MKNVNICKLLRKYVVHPEICPYLLIYLRGERAEKEGPPICCFTSNTLCWPVVGARNSIHVSHVVGRNSVIKTIIVTSHCVMGQKAETTAMGETRTRILM